MSRADAAGGRAVPVLRLAVVLGCGAEAWRILQADGALFSYLFVHRGWGEAAALAVVRCGAALLAVAAATAWWRRAWPLCVLASLWLATGVVAEAHDSEFLPAWVAPAHAARALAPLALALVARGHRAGPAVARWAIAATFAAHGVEALWANAVFVDLLLAASRALGAGLPDRTAIAVLVAIGIADLAAALVVIAAARRAPGRWGLLYMAAWGGITALSRFGFGAAWWPEVLVRAPHCLLPLALWRAQPRMETWNRDPQ